MTSTPDLQTRLQTVRSHYRVTPWIQPHEDESPLLRSWQRCRAAGMREHERVNFELVSRSLLSELDDRHGELVRLARPETERLAHALRGTGSAVLLFNAGGVIIDRLCHEAATPAALLQASRKGMNIAERCVGTTAPAIALSEGLPYLVGRDAHYFDDVRAFFCVAAPIDAPDGRRLGALDITTYDKVPGFDIYSLVVDAAAAIENSLFAPTADSLLVHFHPRAELVGTPMQGLLQVDERGGVSGANRMAARLLCTTRAALVGCRFTALFDRQLQSMFSPLAGRHAGLVEMQSHVGLQVMARFEGEPVRAPAGRGWAGAAAALTGDVHNPGDAGAPAPAAPVPVRPAKLRELEREAIAQALAAAGGNVSVAARRLGISRNTIYRRLNATG